MTEKELIRKIRALRQIKPSKDWVVLTKNKILGQESQTTPLILFQPKPVFAVATTIMLLIAGIAGFFYLTKGPTEIAETPAEIEQAEMIVLALEELQNEVNQATETLKKIKEPQKVLEARNVVVPTIEAVREVITEVEKTEQDSQVLAVKIGVDELENTLDEMMAIHAKNLIQYLETRTLTEAQQEILEKAKQAYDEGNYAEALINCLFVSQLNK